MVWDGVIWYGGALPRIDLSYFDERTSGFAKILVSSLDGLTTAVEIAVDPVTPNAGYQFGYLSSPNDWIASIISLDSEDGKFKEKGVAEESYTYLPYINGLLSNSGLLTTRTSGGLGRIYYRDGSQISQSGLASDELLLFPGIVGPLGQYRYAPDHLSTLRRTTVSVIEYRDSAGVVKDLDCSGATLPEFLMTGQRYTYAPPYLYAIDSVGFFDSALQTVTVYRNLIDLDADTVTLDNELQARCRGIALDPDGNDPTPLAAVFYPS
jgi:hypothetical protein